MEYLIGSFKWGFSLAASTSSYSGIEGSYGFCFYGIGALKLHVDFDLIISAIFPL
jgi:hypothetical protein